jgi:hypothetical protein
MRSDVFESSHPPKQSLQVEASPPRQLIQVELTPLEQAAAQDSATVAHWKGLQLCWRELLFWVPVYVLWTGGD